MKALNTIKIFTLVGALLSQSVFAELSNMKASVTIAYKGGLFSSEPSAEIKKEAVEQARLVAWKKYVSKMSGQLKICISQDRICSLIICQIMLWKLLFLMMSWIKKLRNTL